MEAQVTHMSNPLASLPTQGQSFTAWQYMSKDKGEGVLFAFRTHLPEPAKLPPIYLQGLDPQANYTIEGFSEARSGRAWMSLGMALPLTNFESTVRRIRRVQAG
jgi:alpha-galactosidase